MFASVLIANRGEISLRVTRTLKLLGVESIAVFSDADRAAPHVLAADRSLRLGPTPAAASYLNVERVIDVALRAGADAIHPGYGFLSERADFAQACADAGIVFVGPSPEAIALLGDKAAAKRAAIAADVPVVPGLAEALGDDEIAAWVAGAELPVMLKAAGGGGGRGMRIVRSLAELPEALMAARREAAAAFGDERLIVERYVEHARHIEVQVIADEHGNALCLGERECSLQRRHQKVIEEAPSPVVDATLRERMGAAALALARACSYTNAGTVELIADRDEPERFHFLEMNARLQVEHPVTEAVTGLDIVELQLRIAAGERLPLTQEQVQLRGHAIEARIYAESPAKGFLPSSGRILAYREPAGLRFDSGVDRGSTVGTAYDAMLAKAISHAPTRAEALRKLAGGLEGTLVLGLPTNVAWLRALLEVPEVQRGELDTSLLERRGAEIAAPEPDRQLLAGLALVALLERARQADRWHALDGWRMSGRAAARMRLQCSASEESLIAEALPDGEGGWQVAEALPDGAGGWQIAEAPGGEGSGQIAGAKARIRAGRSGDDERDPPVGVELRLEAQDGATRTILTYRDGESVWVVDPSSGCEPVRFAPAQRLASRSANAGSLQAPMPGVVLEVRAERGETVSEGAVLIVLESMKMELAISSPEDGVVQSVGVSAGERVREGQSLLRLGPAAGLEEAETHRPDAEADAAQPAPAGAGPPQTPRGGR
jgi:acetyl-CoA/propionyl-CoA carboxylase, biotin carboxylase, biotin carboxyl carrier protein